MKREASNPFYFYSERRLVELTGEKARNLTELLYVLRFIDGAVVFYHTHHAFLDYHDITPDFRSDFALWVRDEIRNQMLAEKLAGVDPMDYTSIRELREATLDVLEEHIEEYGDKRQARRGNEFFFRRSKSFVLPTGRVAKTLEEFCKHLRKISLRSLFYHFFEARLRHERRTNDFSIWLADSLGLDLLATKIDKIDPYVLTLDQLRRRVISLIESEVAGGSR
ncbi:MAG: hypothetical protein AMJ46_11815 [Latescibacteria bacterium DG_63]|nr:MAG: hypothetical protein AMJ46_11815 [Latescibacteria bacterium DG_63]